jgi:hypothetical protein
MDRQPKAEVLLVVLLNLHIRSYPQLLLLPYLQRLLPDPVAEEDSNLVLAQTPSYMVKK